ncbi:structural protein [Cellulophaga phage phi39:1]|uniref:structural protein n=1 Tax=Cellulophaga phage phi39:1 TaxID=1327993 RepID=UPI000351B6A3|nr:structural protein [Cellulophaga phage phi39:1]AGO49139.1 structural protein [Cellulophaga phage phi39:1]
MAYREVNRSQPNDGLGDDARTWAGKTNENFKEVFSRGFTLFGFLVSRFSYDPLVLNFDKFVEGDKVQGWENSDKLRWVEGIVLSTGISLPGDLDDENKFFITNDKLR